MATFINIRACSVERDCVRGGCINKKKEQYKREADIILMGEHLSLYILIALKLLQVAHARPGTCFIHSASGSD